MKTSLFIMLVILTFGVGQTSDTKSDIELEVKKVLPSRYVPKDNGDLYMTHSGQFRPYIEKKVRGIDYIIAYDEKNREIKYIFTKDKNFKTSDGLQVGAYIEVNRKQIAAYPGWEVRGPKTADGWETLIGFNHEMTILHKGKDAVINPAKYPALEQGQTVKAKITAFVKGQN